MLRSAIILVTSALTRLAAPGVHHMRQIPCACMRMSASADYHIGAAAREVTLRILLPLFFCRGFDDLAPRSTCRSSRQSLHDLHADHGRNLSKTAWLGHQFLIELRNSWPTGNVVKADHPVRRHERRPQLEIAPRCLVGVIAVDKQKPNRSGPPACGLLGGCDHRCNVVLQTHAPQIGPKLVQGRAVPRQDRAGVRPAEAD